MKPSKMKQKTLKTKEQWNKKIIKLAHQVGIEPTYSNYSINVCLEDRWDTDALFGCIGKSCRDELNHIPSLWVVSYTKMVGRGKIEFPSPEEPDLQSCA